MTAILLSAPSVAVSAQSELGGGSLRLHWEVGRGFVLSAGRPHPAPPARGLGLELWQARRQSGHVPQVIRGGRPRYEDHMTYTVRVDKVSCEMSAVANE